MNEEFITCGNVACPETDGPFTGKTLGQAMFLPGGLDYLKRLAEANVAESPSAKTLLSSMPSQPKSSKPKPATLGTTSFSTPADLLKHAIEIGVKMLEAKTYIMHLVRLTYGSYSVRVRANSHGRVTLHIKHPTSVQEVMYTLSPVEIDQSKTDPRVLQSLATRLFGRRFDSLIGVEGPKVVGGRVVGTSTAAAILEDRDDDFTYDAKTGEKFKGRDPFDD